MNRRVLIISGSSEIVVIFVLATATITTYANSLTYSFHYDDFHGIINNPTVRDLRNVSLFFTDPFDRLHGRYPPITTKVPTQYQVGPKDF